MKLLLLAFSLTVRSAFASCGIALPKNVVDCGVYKSMGKQRECHGTEHGCAGTGWFSKTNAKEPNRHINAHQVCRDQGYVDGADEEMFGGNSKTECQLPWATGNKGGVYDITKLGYTVTWKCKGVTNCEVPVGPVTFPDVPVGSCSALPTVVVDCGKYSGDECTGKGAGCVGAGWFSKTNKEEHKPYYKVNGQMICKQQGYKKGIDKNSHGGNWNTQCRFPGLKVGITNKLGGPIAELGQTVTWKCAGERECPPTASPTSQPPTSPPGSPQIKCKDQETIEDCKKGFCKAKGWGGLLRRCKPKKCKKEFKKDMKKDPPVEDKCNASPYCEVVKKTKKGETRVECKEIKQ